MKTPDYAKVAEELRSLVTGDVSLEDTDLEAHARDTSLFYVKPSLVVYPKNTEDVMKLAAYVLKKKEEGEDISITMRSAGTCMTGGPLTQSIVVDVMRYMNHIDRVTDTLATAEPGVYYRDFEKATLEKGWLMPSYPASRELAAIGGMVSNNAGGEKTLIYGKTEKYVHALEVVFANGEKDVISPLTDGKLAAKMNEPTESGRIHKAVYDLVTAHYDEIQAARPTVSKNSSGYYLWNVYDKETGTFDLTKLVVGSQGTLACVTTAVFGGVKPRPFSRMLVMFVPGTTHLGEIIPALLKHNPESVESYDDHTFKIAMKFLGSIMKSMGGNMFTLGFRFIPELWMAITGGIPKIVLIAEFSGETEEEVDKQVEAAYKDMLQFKLPTKYTHSEGEARKYWTFRRESFNLLRNRLAGLRTAPTIDDIIVHPKDLPEFLPKLDAIFAKYPTLVYTVAGHMGNANFHIIPLVNIHEEGITETLHKLMEEVYALVFEYRGSISAEHNDGLLRTPYLSHMFSPTIIKLFEQTKDIFDPYHILNPGKKVYPDKDFAWKHIDMETKK